MISPGATSTPATTSSGRSVPRCWSGHGPRRRGPSRGGATSSGAGRPTRTSAMPGPNAARSRRRRPRSPSGRWSGSRPWRSPGRAGSCELQLAPTIRAAVMSWFGSSHAVLQRGTFELGPIDLEIGWQERIAILGPNGSGKTTLLRALLGEIPLTAGERWIGPGVQVGEMDQARGAAPGGRAPDRRIPGVHRARPRRGTLVAREVRPDRRARRARRARGCHRGSGAGRSSRRSWPGE